MTPEGLIFIIHHQNQSVMFLRVANYRPPDVINQDIESGSYIDFSSFSFHCDPQEFENSQF